jgi:hypothetical protein
MAIEEKEMTSEEKLDKLRELFADAPELGKKALENVLKELGSQAVEEPDPVVSAGRVGARVGKVSELTIIVPLAPGGADRLRAFLRLLNGNPRQGADKVGTLHDMRFVFLEDDTKLLFATAYDGEWDPYIDDFATKIPEFMDYLFSNVEGWPGITSPEVKDFIVAYQLPAEGWFVAHPDLTVTEANRLKRQDAAVQNFLTALN